MALLKSFALSLLCCLAARAASPTPFHDDAESRFKPWYRTLARGVLTPGSTPLYPWPVRLLSVGHTIASYQNYAGSPYFHHGIDLRADAGSDVFASVGGKVINIENYVPGNPAYWEVAIEDEAGFIWQYHHVDRDSIPQNIWNAFRSAGSVPAGTKLGEVYYWPAVTFGERFHHIHLNVLGKGGRYQNPFHFLERLADHEAPEIAEVGILKNGRKWGSSTVSGEYSLYAEISDLVLHDRFHVPPYRITFRMQNRMPVIVWQFSDLPGGDSETRFVHDFYVPSETCGNYQCRKFTIDLGFTTGGKRAFPAEPGDYSAEITAADFAGNQASRTFHWSVR